MAEVMAPAHPSVRTFLGSTNQEILDLAEQVYQREYVLAPSELPSATRGIHGRTTSGAEPLYD